jgi:adenosylcobinamide-phosphate synthase
MQVFVAPLTLLLERLVGYPVPLLRAIGHPVIWMGALIGWLDRTSNRDSGRRIKGVLALLVLMGAVLLPTLAIAVVCRLVPFGWIVEAVLATAFLAQKELGRAVAAVAMGLRQSLAAGRAAVSHIVGRDPEVLDEAGVARAAIESLAESTSDGVIAPLFWLFLGGLPGIAVYKAINTADSMIGHRDERYREFGWASARLDDVVNLIPARLSALLIAAAAPFARAEAGPALKAALRDAMKHDSPNAGWPEAAFAGALGISLGGPRSYGGEMHDLPRFGTGPLELVPADIDRALRLYRATLNVTLVLVAALALLLVRA